MIKENSIQGDLRKMHTKMNGVVEYALPLGDRLIALNEFLGKKIELHFSGDIHCVNCGRKIKKSYNQGYCFPCCQKLAACDICIVRPEKCHFHQGTCREPEWGQSHCMQEHIVYIANASGIKVGITRASQIPTRWIDQGALQALPIYRVASRYISGLLEVFCAQHVSDKTDWRKMLKGSPEPLDLFAKRDVLWTLARECEDELIKKFGGNSVVRITDAEVVDISFPVLHYPEKVKSLGFDKTPSIVATLEGIKGQYLIFDAGVLNIRKHAGYNISTSR